MHSTLDHPSSHSASDELLRQLALGDSTTSPHPYQPSPHDSVGLINYGNGNQSTAAGRARAAQLLSQLPSWPTNHNTNRINTVNTLTARVQGDPDRVGTLQDLARLHGIPVNEGATPNKTVSPTLNPTEILPQPPSHKSEGMRTKLGRLILNIRGYRGSHRK